MTTEMDGVQMQHGNIYDVITWRDDVEGDVTYPDFTSSYDYKPLCCGEKSVGTISARLRISLLLNP